MLKIYQSCELLIYQQDTLVISIFSEVNCYLIPDLRLRVAVCYPVCTATQKEMSIQPEHSAQVSCLFILLNILRMAKML